MADAVNSIGLGRAHMPSSAPNILDPQAPSYMAVASAISALADAGLLDRVPTGWRISESGSELFRRHPESLSFADLRQFPAFVEAGRRRTRDVLRSDYCNLRLGHYAGGRLLFLTGNLDASALLLGYALEYHLKAALVECQGLTKQEDGALHKHNFSDLYTNCRRRELLEDTFVSDDFLKFAGDHFTRRYPIGHRTLVSQNEYWQFGGSVLDTHDDAIVQLDAALARLYGSPNYLLGVRVFSEPGEGTKQFDAYFHRNVFAVAMLRKSAEVQEAALRAGEPLDGRCDDLFKRDGLPPAGMKFQRASRVAELNLAAFFRYPNVGDPDPDPARLVFCDIVDSARRAGVRRGLWVVEKAMGEFGPGAVDVHEDRETREVMLTAFDRKAGKWYRQLLLRSGWHDIISDTEADRQSVDKWFDETKAQFRRLRSNLRVPKA